MSEKTALATKTSENKAQVSLAAKPNENHSQSLDSPVEQILQMQQTMGKIMGPGNLFSAHSA